MLAPELLFRHEQLQVPLIAESTIDLTTRDGAFNLSVAEQFGYGLRRTKKPRWRKKKR